MLKSYKFLGTILTTWAILLVVGGIALSKSLEEPGLIPSKIDGRGIRWEKSRFPLQIVVDPTVSDWYMDVMYAAYLWNIKTGLPLFAIPVLKSTEGLDDIYGLILVREASVASFPHTNLGYTFLGNIIDAPIYLPPGVPDSITARVAVHELGHVLGLDHDPSNQTSVMYPTALTSEFGITDHDITVLREIYGD